jgi:acyl carrier protein
MKERVSLREIQSLIGQQLGRREVGAEDHLLSDLGAESADILNIIASVEDRFHLHIPEEAISGLFTAARIYSYVLDAGENR